MRYVCRLCKNLIYSFVVILFASYLTGNAYAEFVFSAPPRETPEEGQKTYGPLAEYLTELLGEEVRYEHPGNWAKYAVDMRDGKYDIAFDAPHFGAWRINNIKHTPVAKLPGKLAFVVIVKRDEVKLNSMIDLLSVKICALASPNLGTVTVYNMFDNPVYQPQLFEVKGGFKGVYQALIDGQCRAAVIRDNLYFNLSQQEKDALKVIKRSKPIPDQTLTISHRLSSKKKMIVDSLVSVQGSKAASNLLNRFGKEATSFERTELQDYRNLDQLLTGVVWGW